jgi:hypothetical protein
MTFSKLAVIPAVLGLIALSVPAQAGERKVGNTAMGATAGLLVLGPIGAVAGGVIGYTSGDHIAYRMGWKRHHRHRRTAHSQR